VGSKCVGAVNWTVKGGGCGQSMCGCGQVSSKCVGVVKWAAKRARVFIKCGASKECYCLW